MLRLRLRSVVAAQLVGAYAVGAFKRPSPSLAMPRHFAHGGHGEGAEGGDFGATRLYPQPEVVERGFIEAGALHRVAYSVYGNPEGKAVLFVHGGPGGGTTPMNARYFDPAHYRVVLVDQRGCGASTPFAELEENTTWDLVADFERVRETLGIDEWLVFGGSWGSTQGSKRVRRWPTSKAPISVVSHSFRLMFRRAIISRSDLERERLSLERARAAQPS